MTLAKTINHATMTRFILWMLLSMLSPATVSNNPSLLFAHASISSAHATNSNIIGSSSNLRKLSSSAIAATMNETKSPTPPTITPPAPATNPDGNNVPGATPVTPADNTPPAPSTPTPPPTQAPTKKYEPAPDDNGENENEDEKKKEEEEKEKHKPKAGMIVLWTVLSFAFVWAMCYFRDPIVFFFASAWNNTRRYGCKGCIKSCCPCIFGSLGDGVVGGNSEPLDQIIFETDDANADMRRGLMD